jgi:hypothetical protein
VEEKASAQTAAADWSLNARESPRDISLRFCLALK